MTYKPTAPEEWGTGRIPPAVNTYEGPAPYEGHVHQPQAEPEDAPWPVKCVVTCAYPAGTARTRRVLVVRHGKRWYRKVRCPCCGGKADVLIPPDPPGCPHCGAGADEDPGPALEVTRIPWRTRVGAWFSLDGRKSKEIDEEDLA
jgi:hypothetical protein